MSTLSTPLLSWLCASVFLIRSTMGLSSSHLYFLLVSFLLLLLSLPSSTAYTRLGENNMDFSSWDRVLKKCIVQGACLTSISFFISLPVSFPQTLVDSLFLLDIRTSSPSPDQRIAGVMLNKFDYACLNNNTDFASFGNLIRDADTTFTDFENAPSTSLPSYSHCISSKRSG